MPTPIKSRKNRKKKSESKPKKCSCSGKPMGNKTPCEYAKCLRRGQIRLYGRKLAEKK